MLIGYSILYVCSDYIAISKTDRIGEKKLKNYSQYLIENFKIIYGFIYHCKKFQSFKCCTEYSTSRHSLLHSPKYHIHSCYLNIQLHFPTNFLVHNHGRERPPMFTKDIHIYL